MTSIDRYIAICHPLHNYSWTTKQSHVMVAGAWAIGIVLSCPQLFIFQYRDDMPLQPYAYCTDQYSFWPGWVITVYTLSTSFLMFFIPLIIMSVMYGFISWTVWKNVHLKKTAKRKETGSVNQKSGHVQTGSAAKEVAPRAHSRRSLSRAKLKTVLLTLVVIVAFIVCCTPFHVLMIWWAVQPSAQDSYGFLFVTILSSLNSCCNPWIYMAFSGNLIQRLFPCCNDTRRELRTTRNNSLNSKCETEYSVVSTGCRGRCRPLRQDIELTGLPRGQCNMETCSLTGADNKQVEFNSRKLDLIRQKSVSDGNITSRNSADCVQNGTSVDKAIPTITITEDNDPKRENDKLVG